MSYKPIPNPATWTQADWYVDWVAGLDTNAGTIGSPVKTVMGGVVAKWGTDSPALNQHTTIHIVTPQPPGAEQIFLNPLMNGFNFVIVGTPVLSAAIVLGAVTSKNRGTKTILQAAGFAGHTAGQLVVNTTAGKASHALILAVSGGGVATLMQPLVPLVEGVDSPYFPAPAEVDTWAIGDTVSVYDLPILNMVDIAVQGPQTNPADTQGATLWMQSLRIPDPSGTPGVCNFCPEYEGSFLVFQDMWFESSLVTSPDAALSSVINVWCQYGYTFQYTTFLGGAISGYGGQFQHENWLDADVIIDAVSACSGFLYGGYVAIDATGGLILHPGSAMEIRSLWYGNGFLYGAGSLTLQGDSSCIRRSPTASWVACLNLGTLQLPNVTTTGSAYAGGVRQDGIALTPANLDTYQGLSSTPPSAYFSEDLGAPPAAPTTSQWGLPGGLNRLVGAFLTNRRTFAVPFTLDQGGVSDKQVVITATLLATLSAAAHADGREVEFLIDTTASGSGGADVALTIAPAGAELINGVNANWATTVLGEAGGRVVFVKLRGDGAVVRIGT